MAIGFEVIDDDLNVANALKRALAGKLEGATLIAIDQFDPSDTSIELKGGLDIALEKAKDGKPIILYGVDSKYLLMDDVRFVGLLGMSNTGYVKIPGKLSEFVEVYELIVENKKIADPLAVALLEATQYRYTMGILKHDLKPWVKADPKQLKNWLEKARKVLEGTDEEIISTVEAYEPEKLKGPFADRIFPDVFVDAEDTLFNADGELRQDILELAQRIASEQNRPLTVWTGGEVKRIQKLLKTHQIPIKTVSKYDFSGGIVEVAIDDLPQSTFELMYLIKVKDYRQI